MKLICHKCQSRYGDSMLPRNLIECKPFHVSRFVACQRIWYESFGKMPTANMKMSHCTVFL